MPECRSWGVQMLGEGFSAVNAATSLATSILLLLTLVSRQTTGRPSHLQTIQTSQSRVVSWQTFKLDWRGLCSDLELCAFQAHPDLGNFADAVNG